MTLFVYYHCCDSCYSYYADYVPVRMDLAGIYGLHVHYYLVGDHIGQCLFQKKKTTTTRAICCYSRCYEAFKVGDRVAVKPSLYTLLNCLKKPRKYSLCADTVFSFASTS